LIVNLFNAQQNLAFSTIDTVKLETRTGGNELDSITEYHAGFVVLSPGSFKNSLFGQYNNDYSFSLTRLNSTFIPFQKRNFKFTAAPHLGFMYSFGSKGIQMLNVEYQQFFSKKFGLNLSLNRNSMGEMVREGDFKFSETQLKSRFLDKRYKNYLDLSYQKIIKHHNGGLDTAQSVLEFPLTFLKARKTNAFDSIQQFKIQTEHYLNFLDDSIRGFGLNLNQKLSISNRVYREEDSLQKIYSKINLDSLKTRDQFQFAKVSNELGVYVSNKNLNFTFNFLHAYWRFQNLAQNQDTVELALSSALQFKIGKINLRNQFYFNLSGAKGEKYNNLIVSYKHAKFDLNGFLNFSQKLPDLWQRSYFANNYSWKLTNLKLQTNTSVGGEFSFKMKQDLKAGMSYTNLKNNYFFVDSVWRNDTLNQLSLLSLNVRTSLKYKFLLFQPSIILNQFSSDLSHLPKLDFRSRLAINKKVFKSQKLDFILGVDFTYQSARKLIAYNNALDLFVLTNSSEKTNPNQYKFDVFTGIQVETFRFYIKAENLNYIWDKSDSYIYQGIPITPFYLRIGLTWDFFN
jgi:hypothetical protein